MTISTPMTPEAKGLLSKTIRDLRGRLLQDLEESLRGSYKLGIDASKAKLDRASARKRDRLERWIAEQQRALEGKASKPGKAKAGKAAKPAKPSKAKDDAPLRLRGEVVKQAAYTLLNRLIYLRLLEASGLRKTAVLAGGWSSPGYRDFRELAPELLRDPSERDKSEGYAMLLRLVFDELALDLPGLYGRNGLADLVPVPHETLRYVVEQLDRRELEGCWTDDMTLGWVYQYWNDPEREALDAKLNEGGKVERHEIASKTQMFTERYMVDWLLQNSLGPMWLAMCKQQGWTPLCEQHGTLERLEQRRIAWRAKRDAGEVALTELMPLDGDEERRWAYYLPQPIPDDAVGHAPTSVRAIKLLDPAVGSGHFLVVAFDLLFALYREEAEHRGERWTDAEIVESILANNLHGIDLDPRAVQIAAAGLWLKAQQIAPGARPRAMNLVASQLRLAGLPEDDPALVELRDAVYAETKIPAGLTNEVVAALEGADYLGSLLKVGDALDKAIAKHRQVQAQPEQGSLLEGFGPAQVKVDFDAGDAKARLLEQLEGFLAAHTGSADLGLRLRGEQLAAGVRFLRLVREGAYDLVVGNPPYQGTAKMVDAAYVQKTYPRGKADLFAAFLERGLELVRVGGVSALLTMRNWMFLKQYADLRMWLLETYDLRALHDLSSGAFEEIHAAQVVVSVVTSVFRRVPTSCRAALALKVFDEATVTSLGEAQRKRAATLCQVGRHAFEPAALKAVPEWPLVYWWNASRLSVYRQSELLSHRFAVRNGLSTQDNVRFLRMAWEVPFFAPADAAREGGRTWPILHWAPYTKGAAGRAWYEDVRHVVRWRCGALELYVWIEAYRVRIPGAYIKSEMYYFKRGCAFSMIGNTFAGRIHRMPGVFGHMGASVFPATEDELCKIACLFNSSGAKDILESLNPTAHFLVGDVTRLPFSPVSESHQIVARVESAFTTHESHREPSVEFQIPGPSPWIHAQAWAQLAVDRPENTPLPPYTESLTPEPNTDHLSYALGVALGRFGPPSSPGILDPTTADLAHALPDGILFLDGESEQDNLGHAACDLLRATWDTHRPSETKRSSLREYLRLDFFSEVHRSMYENRPIHWPLSSSKRTFVAWINIHRWHAGTLRNLLANHLNPAKQGLEGQAADARKLRDSGDAKQIRAAEKRIAALDKALAELVEFIEEVSQCAEQGPPAVDAKAAKESKRERDAAYDPDLDDGVMVNSSALWPLLAPQWKDPKKWWKELAEAKGRKDYDWSHLAAKYFPERVDAKCQEDPSLGVAHGCFWKYHPARAYAWELRLQDEIGPEFTIDEADSDEARARFLAEQPNEAKELSDKEFKRRDAKRAKQQRASEGSLFDPEDGDDAGDGGDDEGDDAEDDE